MNRLWIAAFLAAGCAAPSRPVEKPSSLDQRLADNPGDAKVNLELGQASESQGDYLRAEQYYLRAEALGQKDMLPKLLRVLVAAQRYGEALLVCKRRLQAAPDDRTTRFVKAALLQATDKPKEAERELQTLLHTKRDDPRPYLELGRLYRDLHDPPQARTMYETFLTLAPTSEAAAEVRFELAEDPRLQPDPAAEPPPPDVKIK